MQRARKFAPLLLGFFAVAWSVRSVAATEPAVASEVKKFQGTWIIISAEIEDRPATQLRGDEYVFSGNTLTIHYKDKTGGPFTFHLDPARNPKWIDYQLQNSFNQHHQGIYQLDGDTLKLSVTNEPSRPKELNSEDALFLVLQRKKPNHHGSEK